MIDNPGHDKINGLHKYVLQQSRTVLFVSLCTSREKNIELYLIIIESEMERLKRMRDIVDARLAVFPKVRRTVEQVR